MTFNPARNGPLALLRGRASREARKQNVIEQRDTGALEVVLSR
jgi:hypothetical protein